VSTLRVDVGALINQQLYYLVMPILCHHPQRCLVIVIFGLYVGFFLQQLSRRYLLAMSGSPQQR
jgi:hypothetical protein